MKYTITPSNAKAFYTYGYQGIAFSSPLSGESRSMYLAGLEKRIQGDLISKLPNENARRLCVILSNACFTLSWRDIVTLLNRYLSPHVAAFAPNEESSYGKDAVLHPVYSEINKRRAIKHLIARFGNAPYSLKIGGDVRIVIQCIDGKFFLDNGADNHA